MRIGIWRTGWDDLKVSRNALWMQPNHQYAEPKARHSHRPVRTERETKQHEHGEQGQRDVWTGAATLFGACEVHIDRKPPDLVVRFAPAQKVQNLARVLLLGGVIGAKHRIHAPPTQHLIVKLA